MLSRHRGGETAPTQTPSVSSNRSLQKSSCSLTGSFFPSRNYAASFPTSLCAVLCGTANPPSRCSVCQGQYLLSTLLTQPEQAQLMGQNAKQFIAENSGAIAKTLALI